MLVTVSRGLKKKYIYINIMDLNGVWLQGCVFERLCNFKKGETLNKFTLFVSLYLIIWIDYSVLLLILYFTD